MTTQLTRSDVPADVVDRVRRAQQARDAADKSRLDAALSRLKEQFRTERSRVIPAEVDRRLKEYAAANRLPEDTRLTPEEAARRHAADRSFAAGLGVDFAALDRLHADFRNRHLALGKPPVSPDGEVTVLPDQSEPGLQRAGGWHGSWDAGWELSTTNPGRTHVYNADSYFLPDWSRTGSHMRYRVSLADDWDIVSMKWRNGYMRLYTLPYNAHLAIDLYLTCAFSYHFIDTDNAPGWSYAGIHTSQSGIAEIYWNWADEYPQEQVGGGEITWRSTHSLEAYINEPTVPTGARRKVRVTSANWYPAGSTVAVFGSTFHFLHSALDDERVTAGVNAAWYLDELRITPV